MKNIWEATMHKKRAKERSKEDCHSVGEEKKLQALKRILKKSATDQVGPVKNITEHSKECGGSKKRAVTK